MYVQTCKTRSQLEEVLSADIVIIMNINIIFIYIANTAQPYYIYVYITHSVYCAIKNRN